MIFPVFISNNGTQTPEEYSARQHGKSPLDGNNHSVSGGNESPPEARSPEYRQTSQTNRHREELPESLPAAHSANRRKTTPTEDRKESHPHGTAPGNSKAAAGSKHSHCKPSGRENDAGTPEEPTRSAPRRKTFPRKASFPESSP